MNDSETEKPMTYTPENDDRWKVPLSSDPRVTNAMVLAALDASDPGWRDVGASNVWPMVRALEAVVNHRDVFLFAPDSQDRPETDT